MSCQMAMALRPRLNPSSIVSQYGSQALAEGCGLGGWSPCFSGVLPPGSVVTSLAGFASVESVLASFKTLLMATETIRRLVAVTVSGVIIVGRFSGDPHWPDLVDR